MHSSDSDSDSEWNRQLFFAIYKKQGKGAEISEDDRCKQMQECLDRGADINTAGKNNNTVLHVAVKRGYQEIVKFLRQRGARTDIYNQQGYTAITLAENLNEIEIASVLKESFKRRSEQIIHQPRPATEFMSVDNERPSTSRESTLPSRDFSTTRMFDNPVNKSGSVTKRKLNTDDRYDKTDKKPCLALHDPPQFERHSDLKVITDSRETSLSADPHIAGTAQRIIQTPPFDDKKTYAASGLKRSLHGIVYQWKHLMLILYRAWKMGYSFRLATEMDAAEKFDDVVLEYEVSPGNKVHRFVQLKHKQAGGDCEMISVNDLLDVEDGEFSMLKYFVSWLKIRKNSEFSGSKSKKFILCTNIGLDTEGLKNKNIDVREVRELDKFLNATVRTARLPLFYKFESKPSELCNTLKFASDVHRLAKELAQRVRGSKDIYLNTDIIKCYHIALAQEVIDIKNQKFFLDFVENNDLSAKAKSFREIFLLHAKKLFPRNASEADIWTVLRENKLKLSTTFGTKFELATKPQLTHIDQFSDEFVNLLNGALSDNVVKIDRRIYNKRTSDLSKRVVGDNIDKLAGHVLITQNRKIKFRSHFLKNDIQLQGNIKVFRDALKNKLGSTFHKLDEFELQINNFNTCTEEELTTRTELPDDEITDIEISYFLDEIVLAVDQPNEIELAEMIKREIGGYSQFNLLNVDFIGDSFQDAILDWFKKTGKHSKFLANQDAEAFFIAMERELSSLITVGLNLPYSAELKKYDIKFERENRDLQNFLSTSDSTQKPIFQLISSNPTLVTALRVYQTLEQIEKYKKHDSFIFVHLEKLLLPDIMNQVLRAFESSRSHDLLLVDCQSISVNPDAQRLWNRLCELIMQNSRKKMILIIQGNNDSAIQFKISYKISHEKINEISINNLNKHSRQKLLEKRIIKFQGHAETTSFERLLNRDHVGSKKMNDLGRIIDSNTLVQLIQDEEIVIGSKVKELCEIENYYIPRTIIQHVVIRSAILQDGKIPDLCAIGGIGREALKKLVATETRAESFDKCNQTRLYLRNYFILEGGREKCHFETICGQNSNRNIHWLQSVSGKLLWVKSFGTITNLIAFEDVSRDFDNNNRPGATCFTEDELIKHDEQHKIIILSDTAGMGKTTVLTHLARKIKQNQSSMLVIRIDLTQYTTVLAEEQNKRTFDSKDTKRAIDFLVNKLLSCSAEIEREIYKTIIMVTGDATLLFDGFDEISPTYENTVINLLQALANLNLKKLIVTTRPHTSKVLERELKTFSYTLQAFSEANQVEFLTKFWRRGLNSNDFHETTREHLEKHAHTVQKILVKSISQQMQEFTGVPLQTRLVAEAFPYKQKHLNSSTEIPGSQDDTPKLPEVINIIDLYKHFVDVKYQIFCEEKKSGDQTNLAEIKDNKVTRQMFLVTHQKLALNALFDGEIIKLLLSSQPEIDILCSLFQDKKDGEERTGIINQVINGKPHFIHRTFAEYFAAIFLINTLKDSSRNQQVRKFCISQLFVQSEYKTIRAFINCLLSTGDKVVEKESWNYYLRENRNTNHQTVYHVAAYEVNVEIVRFFLNRLGENFKEETPHNITDNYGPTRVPVTASRGHCSEPKLPVKYEGKEGHFSNTDSRTWLVTRSLDQEANINLRDGFGLTPLAIAASKASSLDVVTCFVEGGADVNYTCVGIQTPLSCAVQKADNLDIVKYLVEKGANPNFQAVGGLTPLHSAVRQAGNLDLVRYLVEKGGKVDSESVYGWTPLHYAAEIVGNLDVVKYLVEKGANIMHEANGHGTPLHFSAGGDDHLDIVKYLVEKGANIMSQTESGDTPLHCAVRETGNLDIVKYLVEKGAIIIPETKDGHTPLHYAAREAGNLNVLKYLIEEGADIFAKTKDGHTPLHYAVREAHNSDVVKYLGEKGAIINAQTENGWTALHYAVRLTGNLDAVKYLIEKGANIVFQTEDGWTPLHHAVLVAGNLDIVKYLVEQGADIISKTNGGATVLHHAAYKVDNLEIVKYLVENGANMTSETNGGDTTLHCAARKANNLDVVKYLVEKGADIISQTKGGLTPLHYAVHLAGNLDAVKYLVKEGANIICETKCGDTPLHYAVRIVNNLDVVEYLVKKGANIISQGEDGNTPLHYAVRITDNLKVVKYLVKKAANIISQTECGDTPLHCAVRETGNLDIVKYLVEKGANIDSQTNGGNTPLHCAVSEAGNLDVVKYLVEKGANIISEGEYGYTPLHCASKQAGNLDVVKYLVENGANIISQTKNGDTPLHCAARIVGTLDILMYFLEKNANIIPLDVMKHLLEKVANINIQNAVGCTVQQSTDAKANNSNIVNYTNKKVANINIDEEDCLNHLH